jgi:heme exporter protein D
MEQSGMIVTRVLVAAVGGVLFAAAGVAAAGNFSSDRQVDFFAKGTHQFYVWCAGQADYLATAKGANAEEAQMTLYRQIKAEGKTACWPVWQGRVAGA